MPTVPIYQDGGVVTTAVQSPRASGALPQGAYGADLARGLNALGNVGHEIALDQKKLDDETKVKEREVAYTREVRDLLYNPETGFYNLNGKHAVESRAEVKEKLESLRSSYAGMAENNAQKRLFNHALNLRHEKMLGSIDSFVSRERESWQLETAKARAAEQMSLALDNINDPKALKQSLATGLAEIQAQARLAGLSPESAQLAAAQYQDRFHAAIISSLITNDRGAEAETYLVANADNITSAARDKLKKATEQAGRLGRVQAQTDTIVAGGGSLSEMLSQARAIDDPKVRKDVVSAVKLRFNEQQTIRKFNEQETRLNAVRHVLQGGDPDAISFDDQATLGLSTMSGLRSYAAKLASGEFEPADNKRYLAWKNQALRPETRQNFLDMNFLEDGEYQRLGTRNVEKLIALQQSMLNAEAAKDAALQAKINKSQKAQQDAFSKMLAGSVSQAQKLGGKILSDMKLDKDSEEAIAFQVALEEAIHEQRLATGEDLTQTEMNDLAQSLLQEVVIQEGLFSDTTALVQDLPRPAGATAYDMARMAQILERSNKPLTEESFGKLWSVIEQAKKHRGE